MKEFLGYCVFVGILILTIYVGRWILSDEVCNIEPGTQIEYSQTFIRGGADPGKGTLVSNETEPCCLVEKADGGFEYIPYDRIWEIKIK